MPRSEDYESWCNLERDNAYMKKMQKELGEPTERDQKSQINKESETK